jgi:predicted dehydrogenase
METTGIGIVGCGNISSIYLQNCGRLEGIEVRAVADLDQKKARSQAEKHNVPTVCSVEEMLRMDQVQIVLNLTPPPAHASLAQAALHAGKHVYVEKPLAVTREQGQEILELAWQKDLRIGCAPDTFLGAGLQTCRKIIDDGLIGKPIGATAFLTCHGHESWHPSPEFYYKPGGGPMLDMGPYYLTALVSLIGPVRSVTGTTAITFPQRTITSEPLKGARIDVEVPTHVAGIMEFDQGAVGTILTSFDIWAANLPRIEIYGTEGSLSVPDPNRFGGPVLLRTAGDSEWIERELVLPYDANSRGVGLADMASAIRNERPHRASGQLGLHVLDIMQSIHEASDNRQHKTLETTVTRPDPLPQGLKENQID